jgi:tripartite-type tricarboxylate transporter receptor subunit TctC
MHKFLVGLVGCVLINVSWAWQPTNPVRVVVGQTPGGGNELALRGVAQIIEKTQPVNFIVQHYPGLDNVVAMNHFANQKPDGQTLLVTALETSFVAAPVAHKSQLLVDPMEYVPVTILAQAPMAFVVPINSPIKTMSDLVARLKKQDFKKFNVGLSGSTNVLTYHYFVKRLGINPDLIQPVNYNSPTATVTDVAGGNLDLAIVSISSTRALLGNKIRMLAHTGNTPIAALPDIDLAKNHVPGLVINVSWSVFLPPRTPPHVVAWYTTQFQQALNTSEARAFFYSNFATINPKAQSSSGLANAIADLRQNWNRTAEAVLVDKK